MGLEVVLPPLKATTQRIYALEFASDGYPQRRDPETGRLIATPIFGKYAMQDYLLQWEQTGDAAFLEAAATVGRAALGRMSRFRGALAFFYDEDVAPVRNAGRHYSGLTQSHYLVMLEKLAARTGDARFRDAAAQVLASLLIPAEDGGVLYRRSYGSIIAETPLKPQDVVLNGWLTAMVNVHDYAQASGSATAERLFADNLRALEATIDRFDVPALCNTRYGTAGFAYFRVNLPAAGARSLVRDVSLVVPDEPPYPVKQLGGTRWEQHVFEADVTRKDLFGFRMKGRSLRMNLVLNALTAPAPNVLRVALKAKVGGTATLQMWRGGYNPRATAANADPVWHDVATAEYGRGTTELAFPIGWDSADLVAYPTSFLKRVGDGYFNVYHFLHIDQLRRLHELTGLPFLEEHRRRWVEYVERWASMPVYADVETSPSPHRGHPHA